MILKRSSGFGWAAIDLISDHDLAFGCVSGSNRDDSTALSGWLVRPTSRYDQSIQHIVAYELQWLHDHLKGWYYKQFIPASDHAITGHPFKGDKTQRRYLFRSKCLNWIVALTMHRARSMLNSILDVQVLRRSHVAYLSFGKLTYLSLQQFQYVLIEFCE